MRDPLVDFRWAVDEQIFHAINAYENPALDSLWFALSSREFGALAGLVLALWLLHHYRKHALIPLLQLAMAAALADSLGARVLKPFFARMRPSFALVGDAVRVLSPVADSPSMPSGHSATAFAVATVMALRIPRAGWVLYPFAILVALSRVGVGVHWPSDILAGALFGISIGALVFLPFRHLPGKHAPAHPPVPPPPPPALTQ